MNVRLAAAFAANKRLAVLLLANGRAYHAQFVSAATGIALAIALIRGFARRERKRSAISGSI
jgi:K+-transporting ATPase A subunit